MVNAGGRSDKRSARPPRKLPVIEGSDRRRAERREARSKLSRAMGPGAGRPTVSAASAAAICAASPTEHGLSLSAAAPAGLHTDPRWNPATPVAEYH